MTTVTSEKKTKPTDGIQTAPQGWLSADELRKMHAYWRACNYLAAGMIYLRDNPLLREPLKPEQIKLRLLGHWGASPGLSFTYIHLNRLINKFDLNAIFMAGPGHGAPGVLAPVYLEGAYSEIYPNKGEDIEGMKELFKEFSFPGVHRQTLHAGNARVDSRGRRAGLQRLACVRCRPGQPGPDRGRGGRRR
jgi:phosphoketolase